MVELNRIPASVKREHTEKHLKGHEKMVMAHALRAGENPDTLDLATWPLPDNFEDPIQHELARRIALYNDLHALLESF